MNRSKPVRLDRLLVERRMLTSRTLAREYIEAGRVTVDGIPAAKASSMVSPCADIRLTEAGSAWVSRGAHKLIKGLDSFAIDPAGKICIDIGASTGGFTDVLLARGASRVYAVDVGYGQLAWKLRNDPRVTVMERTNARFLKPEMFADRPADLIVSDASFISLRLLLKPLEALLGDNGEMAVLVKPQFEVGREKVGKGVVRDPRLHEETLLGLASFIEEKTDLTLVNVTFSPIRGPEGNIEFLFHLRSPKGTIIEHEPADFQKTVREAHEATE